MTALTLLLLGNPSAFQLPTPGCCCVHIETTTVNHFHFLPMKNEWERGESTCGRSSRRQVNGERPRRETLPPPPSTPLSSSKGCKSIFMRDLRPRNLEKLLWFLFCEKARKWIRALRFITSLHVENILMSLEMVTYWQITTKKVIVNTLTIWPQQTDSELKVPLVWVSVKSWGILTIIWSPASLHLINSKISSFLKLYFHPKQL